MENQLNNEIAAFRFGLIAPVLHHQLNPGEKYALLKEIASGRYTIPGSDRSTVSIRTIERYLEAHEKDGFNGLKPKIRKKKGSPHMQKEEIRVRTIELRTELPSRSVEKVIQILEYEKMVGIGELKARTLSRFFLEQGWSRRDVHQAVVNSNMMHPMIVGRPIHNIHYISLIQRILQRVLSGTLNEKHSLPISSTQIIE